MYMNVRACIQHVEGITIFWVLISMIIKRFFFRTSLETFTAPVQ